MLKVGFELDFLDHNATCNDNNDKDYLLKKTMNLLNKKMA